MNDDGKSVEDRKIEETGETGTQTVEKNEVKTFTQDEVDSIIKDRLKKYPSKEELKDFKNWKESQKTAEEKQAEKEAEYQKALTDKEELEKEIKVLKAGVNKEDVDYVVFKVSKQEGDFDKNLANFLKDNPKFTNLEPKIIKKVGSSFDMSGKTQTNQNETNSIMNDLIRSARD